MVMFPAVFYRATCRRSFYEFVKYFWSHAFSSKFEKNDLIEYYCELFQYMTRKLWISNYNHINIDTDNVIEIRESTKNLNLVVPPNHSKTIIFNVFGPLWLWTIAPIKAISIAHNKSLALQIQSKWESIINSLPFQRSFYDIKLTANSTTVLKNNKGRVLYSIDHNAFTDYNGDGIVDIIINHDRISTKTRKKDKEEIENALNYFQNTIFSKIPDTTNCIIMNIQHRLVANDTTVDITNNKNLKNQYNFITLPAIFNKTTHLVFPISVNQIKTFKKGEVLGK
ncbi:hypothetical protein V2P50_03170 [Mesomycoplasma hyorhinis]|uniref:hypothetical protein n=1 Tax=Mesomycoplasma hyorhinis TaxID=2100 RepID=UPI003DA46A5A